VFYDANILRVGESFSHLCEALQRQSLLSRGQRQAWIGSILASISQVISRDEIRSTAFASRRTGGLTALPFGVARLSCGKEPSRIDPSSSETLGKISTEAPQTIKHSQRLIASRANNTSNNEFIFFLINSPANQTWHKHDK
jgi:hypothetical protein